MLSKNIKQIRLKKKLTQKELSKLSGINEVQISRYENGLVTNLNFETLKSLATALKCKVSTLLKGT